MERNDPLFEYLKEQQRREREALRRLYEKRNSAPLGPHTNPLRATGGFTEADKTRPVEEAQRIVMEGINHA